MYQDFKFDNSTDVVEKFKKFIEKNDCPKIEVDLSAVNIFKVYGAFFNISLSKISERKITLQNSIRRC